MTDGRLDSEQSSYGHDGGTGATETPPSNSTSPTPASRLAVPQSSLPNADIWLNGPSSGPTPSDWINWNSTPQPVNSIAKEAPAPPVQYDWNSFMASFATQAAKYLNQEVTPQPAQIPPQHAPNSQPQVHSSTEPLPPNPPVSQARSANAAAPLVSPDAESDSQSVFETAKGLAMISLEAAAEPHYVGESSGSLWTTVVSKGLHAPRSSRGPRESSERTSRTPSPTRLAALRAQLARPSTLR